MQQLLYCKDKVVDLSRTAVMGVLNVTPDSFSDGGRYGSVAQAIERAREMVAEGVDLIDVGGESTRPGAEPVPVNEELERVVPVIEALAGEGIPVPISVDTSKPEVMEAAVFAGAGMINDVRALTVPGALEVAREAQVPVCLMHMLGEPRTMQVEPRYDDVVEDVRRFLDQRRQACLAAGIAADHLLLDPGIGFGKSLEDNLRLISNLGRLSELGAALLVGVSRKSLIGKLLDADLDHRLYGSLAGAVIAAWNGARILRVHDVRATAEALRVCDALRGALQ